MKIGVYFGLKRGRELGHFKKVKREGVSTFFFLAKRGRVNGLFVRLNHFFCCVERGAREKKKN